MHNPIAQVEFLVPAWALVAAFSSDSWSYNARWEYRDVLWFIDNTAACSAMIKGASPVRDCSEMALIASTALASIQSRPWFEYVASHQNPADPLSREGYHDAWVEEKLHTGEAKQILLEANLISLLTYTDSRVQLRSFLKFAHQTTYRLKLIE